MCITMYNEGRANYTEAKGAEHYGGARDQNKAAIVKSRGWGCYYEKEEDSTWEKGGRGFEVEHMEDVGGHNNREIRKYSVSKKRREQKKKKSAK